MHPILTSSDHKVQKKGFKFFFPRAPRNAPERRLIRLMVISITFVLSRLGVSLKRHGRREKRPDCVFEGACLFCLLPLSIWPFGLRFQKNQGKEFTRHLPRHHLPLHRHRRFGAIRRTFQCARGGRERDRGQSSWKGSCAT